MIKLPVNDKDRLEYKKCFINPMYFIREYVIKDIDTSYELFDQQKQMVKDIYNNKINFNNITQRHIGASIIYQGYLIWDSIFNPDTDNIAILPSQSISKHYYESIIDIISGLPSWLLVNINNEAFQILNNRIIFYNGSSITVSCTNFNLRGSKFNFVIHDNFDEQSDREQNESHNNSLMILKDKNSKLVLSGDGNTGKYFHQLLEVDPEFTNCNINHYSKIDCNAPWTPKLPEFLNSTQWAHEFECSFDLAPHSD